MARQGFVVDEVSLEREADGVRGSYTTAQSHASNCSVSLETFIQFGCQVADKVCGAMDLALDKCNFATFEQSSAGPRVMHQLHRPAEREPVVDSLHMPIPKVASAAKVRMYYAVKGGSHPGVYDTFQEAQRHAKEPSALCKKFPDYGEAAAWAAS